MFHAWYLKTGYFVTKMSRNFYCCTCASHRERLIKLQVCQTHLQKDMTFRFLWHHLPARNLMQKNRFYKDKMSVRWHPISTTAYLLFIIIIDLRIMKDSNVKGNKYCDTSKGARCGFSGRFEDPDLSWKMKMKICSNLHWRLKMWKNSIFFHVEEWRCEELNVLACWRMKIKQNIATFVKDEECILKKVEDWRFEEPC